MQSANCALPSRLKMCRLIALLSLWEYTGMEKWQMNETSERNIFRHVQTQTYVKWSKCNSLLKLKQSSLCGVADDAISKLCAG